MNSEKFNLHIQTPEADEKDPEIIRLRGELMAIKPLLDEAIKRESLKDAEELYKQAVEAKRKLDEYKESLNKKEEYPTIEINGIKIELGPELGKMTWNIISEKLEQFNKTLRPEEKSWRVPTLDEYKEIDKQINEIKIDNSLSTEEKDKEIREKIKSLGFEYGKPYWTSSEAGSEGAVYVYLSNVANWRGDFRNQSYFVRCIR